MKHLAIIGLMVIITLLLFASPVMAYDPPGQGTGNATDNILWFGDTLTVSSPALTNAIITIGEALQSFVTAMPVLLSLLALVFFSLLGFWRPQAVLSAVVWMIAGGISLALGLTWRHTFPNDMGLSVGLMLIIYWLVCWGYAFAQLFSSRKVEE